MPDTDLTVFDVEQALAAVDHDRELLQELTELFAEDADDMMAEIEKSIESADIETLGRAAHTLKGAVATIGGRALADVARRIEEKARDQDTTGLAVLAVEIRAAFDAFRAALANWTA